MGEGENWFTFHNIFVVGKGVVVILMLVLGIRAHYVFKQHINEIIILFVYYVLLMVLIFIYEYFIDNLRILYFTLLLSNIG
jgi:hypothetical protein